MLGYEKNNDRNFILVIMVISWLYAIIRYNIFKGVEFANLPLYVTNKSLALSAIIILSTAALSYGKDSKKSRNYLNTTGFFLVILHVLISAIILNKDYFSNLFYRGKYTVFGELALLFGILSFLSLLILFLSRISSEKFELTLKKIFNNNYLSMLGLVLLIFHTFFIGIKSWLQPTEWPGYLPPISLFGFIIGFVPLLNKLSRKQLNDK